MTHPSVPERLTPEQTAPLLGLSLSTLKRYRAQRIAPDAVVVGGGKRPRVEYTWEAVNAWLSERGRPAVTPHCPCCGRP